ncbi:MAG: phage head closure protein [Sulfurimonas sp.]
MRIGRLRHIGVVESYTESVNGFGEPTRSWAEFCKVWCDIKPLHGNEKYVSAEKHATATHQVIIRYRRGINPKMRLIARGRTFEIESVLNVNEQDKMMQLIVKEEADND